MANFEVGSEEDDDTYIYLKTNANGPFSSLLHFIFVSIC